MPSCEWRLRRYPARNGGNGRRAREVMPAAIQAEVITSAAAQVDFMRARMLARQPRGRNLPGIIIGYIA
jgi:hypothetical protein